MAGKLVKATSLLGAGVGGGVYYTQGGVLLPVLGNSAPTVVSLVTLTYTLRVICAIPQVQAFPPS
jgi:hypothetical protein